MKINFNILIYSVLLLFSSCNTLSDDNLPKTPNERIQQREKELKTILISAEQGWQMKYFPKVEHKFSDINRNIKASKDFGVVFIERDYGEGGHNIFMKFKENGEVEMLYDNDFNSAQTIKKSRYSISQNSYTQLNFISPNYIFDTGQNSFLYYKKNDDGSLVFTTNRYTDRDKEYIVLTPIDKNTDWKEKMMSIFQTKLFYERKPTKTLTIVDPYGESIFETNFKEKKHTDTNLRYSVFLRNMQPHVYDSKYYTALGSGYLPLENGLMFLPGIQANDSINFITFKKEGDQFVSKIKGFKAIIN